jgi:hypothetical protein
MAPEELYKEVERRLEAVDERLDFHAVEAGVRKDEDWWYVPVVTGMKDGRRASREFAIHILANIETSIFEELKENVLFVPSS